MNDFTSAHYREPAVGHNTVIPVPAASDHFQMGKVIALEIITDLIHLLVRITGPI